MKIVSAIVHHLRIPMETGGQHGWGSEEWKALDFALLELTTNSGLTGWGEGWAYEQPLETIDDMRSILVPRILDQDVSDIAQFTDELLRASTEENYGAAPGFSISAANIALWDLAAKAAGVPLHRLLGKATTERFPAFAGLFQFDEPDAVRKMCSLALADGMCWVKLHEHREDCLRAAREVAPDAVLILDAYRAWKAEEATEMAEFLRQFDFFWLEEPIDPPFDLGALLPFTSAGIPIALGESAHTVREFKRMIASGAVDYLQPAITKMGGIDKVREVIDLGNSAGVQVYPWQAHFGPALLAYLHMNSVRSSPVPVEFQYFESMAARLYGEHVWPSNGFLSVPSGPGLGFDPDPAVLAEFSI